MDLVKFNHWWRKREVNPALKGKPRKILQEILSYRGKRQIIILKGLRRVGKTTLFYQIINHLLEKENVSIYRIMYFSFDEEIENFDEVIKTYQREILKEDLLYTKERCYLFFDEIQKCTGWPEKLKILYDLYPNVKIFVSGSAALTLTKGVKESLAGRFFEFEITPLDFSEYLLFRGLQYQKARINIFKEDILKEFDFFLCNSGYIEMIDERNPEILRRYFQESILERVIYRDIPEQFAIQDPGVLFRILKILASQPGMLVKYKSFSNDLNKDQRTISNYFEYLKWSFLIRTVYLFSHNLLTSEKKLKKHYPAYPAFSSALYGQQEQVFDEFKSRLVENLFVSTLKAKFFYRSSTREEVDVILPVNRTFLPIEVKYKKRVKRQDLSGLRSFMTRYRTNKGYLLSYDLEKEYTFPWGKIYMVPTWKFLLFYEDYKRRGSDLDI